MAIVRKTLLATAVLAALSAPAAAAETPSPPPSGSAFASAPAGTSFLTAGALQPGQEGLVSATTSEYLYWSFPAAAGKDVTAKVTVDLPANRTGDETWRMDVYDGLRREQACVGGAKTAKEQITAKREEASVTLSCTPRTVRGWAEPWSNDPLPGVYFVRVAATNIPDGDAGLAVKVRVKVTTEDGDDAGAQTGQRLSPPLVPVTRAGGAPLNAGTVVHSREVGMPEGADSGDPFGWNWMAGPDGRWVWTAAGAFIAVAFGVAGFQLTRIKRRWFS